MIRAKVPSQVKEIPLFRVNLRRLRRDSLPKNMTRGQKQNQRGVLIETNVWRTFGAACFSFEHSF
jgi:hypothetical protein